jgi:hypothetical protein
LAQFREELATHGIKLLLDFVPNHTAPDHSWVRARPDYYVEGSEEALTGAPGITCGSRPTGTQNPGVWPRPQFSGLAGHPAARLCQSRAAEGADRRADRDCRQVRRRALRHGNAAAGDFPRTRGIDARAVVAQGDGRSAREVPRFHFHGRGLLDLEWTLQQEGFDYCYDKRLYDRLREGHVRPIRIERPRKVQKAR